MPIRFRCPQCRQLSAIATRKAGSAVQCPRCEARIIVPEEDLAEAAWDPDAPGFAGEDPASPHDSDETAEDEWGRLRWESTEQDWDDEDFATDAPPRGAADDGGQPEWDAASERSAQEHSTGRGAKGAAPPMIPPTSNGPPTILSDDDGDGGFEIRKMKSDFEEMDLTPMVDCTFLLLIFFMITASFSLQKTIEVPPPNPDKKGAAQSLQTLDDFKEDSIIVEVDERNNVIIDDEPLAALASLPQVLSNKMLLEKKTELLLMAHEKAWHEMVIAIIDAANEVGMQRIRMAAHGGSDE